MASAPQVATATTSLVLVFNGDFERREGAELNSFMDSFYIVFVFFTQAEKCSVLVKQGHV